MGFLLGQYLTSKEIYSYTTVTSTRYGDVVQHGGMEDDEPYVVFGEWSMLHDNGDWYDPRSEEGVPEELERIKKALVGDDHEGFSVIQPMFGG